MSPWRAGLGANRDLAAMAGLAPAVNLDGAFAAFRHDDRSRGVAVCGASFILGTLPCGLVLTDWYGYRKSTVRTDVALATEDHAERADRHMHSVEAGVVGVVIGRCVLFVHASTLTVEPDFKSSGGVSEPCRRTAVNDRRARTTLRIRARSHGAIGRRERIDPNQSLARWGRTGGIGSP